MDISVILPAYMEAENLKMILPKVQEALSSIEHEVLVVDTMSPMDNTEDVCKANGAIYIPRAGGNNYGDAIRTGFRAATGTYTVVMDADGSHDPKDLVRFYDEMKTEKYDLVIGSRYCKGGYTDNPAILRFMSWVLNCAYRLIFGLKVHDVSDSYRMYKTAQVQTMELECQNFDIVEEILIKLSLLVDGFQVCEVPISFSKRQAGTSKRHLLSFIASYLQTILKLLRIKRSTLRKRA